VSVVRTKIDYAALPEALLDLAKSQMRIEFDRDDAFIQIKLAQAIDLFERTTETAVTGGTWSWVPVAGFTTGDGSFGYAIPFSPVPTIVKVMDANSVDQTARWVVRGPPIPNVYGVHALVALDGAPTSPITVTVNSGYADAETMPPGILNFVLEAAAWLYENREIAAMPGVDGVPYLNQLLTAYWRPRV
jgi:hypothetical protein